MIIDNLPNQRDARRRTIWTGSPWRCEDPYPIERVPVVLENPVGYVDDDMSVASGGPVAW